jgi:hypothetical protein
MTPEQAIRAAVEETLASMGLQDFRATSWFPSMRKEQSQ